jgi:hypothetical protein
MALGFVPGVNNLIVASKFARFVRLRAIRFEVVNVAADFSALGAQGGYNMRLEPGHNTGNLRKAGHLANIARKNAAKSVGAGQFPTK